MRKLFISLALSISAVMIVTASVGGWAAPSTASARLRPLDGSNLKTTISFLDTHNDNTGLIVSGTGKGFDPGKVYITLIFNNDAFPGGRRACEPSDDSLDEERMYAGRWQVNADGTGTLYFVMTEGAYVPLTAFDTVTIRGAAVLGPPETLQLVACGQVSRHR